MRYLIVFCVLAATAAGCSKTTEPAAQATPATQPSSQEPRKPIATTTPIPAEPVVEEPPVDPNDPLAAFRTSKGPATWRPDFKGDTPGVLSIRDFRTSRKPLVETPHSLMGVSVPGVVDAIILEDQLTIANKRVNEASYTFVDGVLARIRLTLAGDSHDDVKAALTEKYGKPTPSGTWDGADGNVYLRNSGPGIEVVYSDDTLSAELDQREKAATLAADQSKAKTNAKDL
ncbi:hypothetical protein [Planctomyces sp. SH-PL14]|uniref:hypothetical protein n=1 Tax=Planctomyces sp. SH-PL14 TaxID=1632864 RepID=UPI00078EED2F|nr:hypothetical protein [Planctomyces sp. SH-PL14]AMV18273.1 hypothetical protein VT03_10315 [Planctomyces sp. SH-PL14]